MASCPIPAKGMVGESTREPNWLELPREVTQNILQRLSVVGIVTSASLVCPLWWNICKDPLMWRTIHMGFHLTSRYDLSKILMYAIDKSCGQVEDIDIKDFCSYQIVQTLSQCERRIKFLWFSHYSEVLGEGSSEVAEEPEVLYNKDIIGVIGTSCPLLKSLKLGSTSDDDAFAIAKTMSGLCHLKIFGGQIPNVGLFAILEGCTNLETLHLKDCPNLDLSGSLGKKCRDQIKDFKYLENYQEGESYEEYLGEYPNEPFWEFQDFY